MSEALFDAHEQAPKIGGPLGGAGQKLGRAGPSGGAVVTVFFISSNQWAFGCALRVATGDALTGRLPPAGRVGDQVVPRTIGVASHRAGAPWEKQGDINHLTLPPIWDAQVKVDYDYRSHSFFPPSTIVSGRQVFTSGDIIFSNEEEEEYDDEEEWSETP